MKNIIEKIKEDNWFDDGHDLIKSGEISIVQEEITNPRREMLGTEYLIRKKDSSEFGVIETVDDENWDDGLWRCEECDVEKIVGYKIISK